MMKWEGMVYLLSVVMIRVTLIVFCYLFSIQREKMEQSSLSIHRHGSDIFYGPLKNNSPSFVLLRYFTE